LRIHIKIVTIRYSIKKKYKSDQRGRNMKTDSILVGILAIVAGVLVLWMPAMLTWIVGIFLIVYGIVTLAGKR